MEGYPFFIGKYGSFTSIQKIAIPIIEKGDNCIIIAPTGSGKTEAAVLPLIEIAAKGTPISVLYITPLRALNRDMMKRLEDLCSHSKATVGVRHGDTSVSERRKQARLAPSMLITTPETLQSILPTKHMGAYLKNIKAVVVDELHELYHSKRGAQLSLALERLERIAPGFQRIGISATVGDPGTIAKFLCGKRSCRIADSGSVKESSFSVEFPSKTDDMHNLIERFGLDRQSASRLERISELVEESRSTLIFANTRQIVESIGSRLLYLERVKSFGGIGVHHSSLSRDERIEMEERFRNGSIKGLVATSSLELGIDIGSIDLVVQYGSPRQALRLAQRIGRSGHSHSRQSRGIVIATNPMEILETLAIFDVAYKGSYESFRMHEKALDVLANQICGMALDCGSVPLDELHRTISGSFLYRRIDLKELSSLLDFMSKLRLVGFDGTRITAGGRTRMYYYGHLSVIPDTKRFLVKNASENRVISTLDESFVANNVDVDSVFITKGLPWKVLSIDGNVISVEPSADLDAAVPDWSGEDIPVSRLVANGVLESFKKGIGTTAKGMATPDAIGRAESLINSQRKSFAIDNGVVVERLDEHCIVHTGLGTKANEGVSRLLAHIIGVRLGRSVRVKSSPYMVMLEVGRDADVAAILKRIGADDAEPGISRALADTEIFRYRFITIAKLFGVIDRDAAVSRSMARRIMKVMESSPIHAETIRELMENYFDIGEIKEFFSGIEKGQIPIRVIDAGAASALTKAILSSAYYAKELVTPLVPNRDLMESFSDFILSKSSKLICTYCGLKFSRKLKELRSEQRITCASCGSPMIAQYGEEYEAVIKKRIGEKRLDRKEKATFAEMMRTVSLIEAHGGRAVIALSVYGIGPRSAARALMMLKHDEKDFFIDLIDLQRNFIRNKKYWSV